MNTRPKTEQEWNDFCDFMKEYNTNKELKKKNLHDSLLYSIYMKVKKMTNKK